MQNVGNPPLCSGVIAVPSGPKSHALTVILAVFAPQPRMRHKPWKSLFPVYSPHLRSRKLFKCTQLIAVLSGPLFISWSATNLAMSVFSFENQHTLLQGGLANPSRGKNLEILVLELGKVLRTLKLGSEICQISEWVTYSTWQLCHGLSVYPDFGGRLIWIYASYCSVSLNMHTSRAEYSKNMRPNLISEAQTLWS